MRRTSKISFLVYRGLWHIATAISFYGSHSQSIDSLKMLQEVVIADTRIENHSVGYRMERLDSLAIDGSRAANLTELLTRNSNVHVRSYGINGLSAPNLRGSGNSHTTILWNGISLQSPAAGQLDISLLPTSFIDNLTVQYGGAASLYGSGSIGGAIHLQNKPHFNQGLELGTYQNYGSYRRHHQSYSVAWGNRHLSTSLRLFGYSAKNDFKFKNETIAGSPKERRIHNGTDQKGLLFQNYWKWNSKNQLSFRFWVQDNEVEIPNPATVSLAGQSVQKDKFNRSLLTWEHDGDRYTSTFKSGLINHATNFDDHVRNLSSSNAYHSLINEFEVNKKFAARLETNLGINHTYEWVSSNNYAPNRPERNRTSLFISAKQFIGPGTILNLRARQETIDGDLTPFAPSLGLEQFVFKNLLVKTSLSRNYLIPTFNQLFWSGAGGFGNPTLKPEHSWSEELGLAYNYGPPDRWLTIETEITVFSNQVENWILWVPLSSSEWSPHNIKKVWARGLEQSGKIILRRGHLIFELQGSYSLTKATNQRISETGNPIEINKQLIYTPLHSGKLRTTVAYKTFRFGWWHHITGKQFTTGDNSRFHTVDRFGLSTLILEKSISLKPVDITFQFEAGNLFNKNYQVRAGYPMPLRNFRFGLNMKY